VETKRCYACKQDKLLAEFPINRKRRDGRGTLCKACKQTYNAAYYLRTKNRHNPGRAERRKRARDEAREKVYEYLSSHPCVDCGEADIVVLDFDHQGDKVAEINNMINDGRAWSSILAEIAKCEIVCANDHRRRTAATFGWRRAVISSVASSIGRALDS
jgi:hypothetical protein